MKHSIILLLLLATINFSFSQGIEFFHGTWEEALEASKKEGKSIFVDAYTTWCGPCKAMAKNTFTVKEVGDFFNKNFINVKFDMEKEEGVKFGHTYPVQAYPTLYFINDKGDVLKKVVGGQKPEGLIANAKEALKADDRSGEFEEEYLNGNREYDLVYGYVKALNNVGKPTLKISNDYLDTNPEITIEQKLAFIFEAAVEADSKLFDDVILQKAKIIEIVGEEVFAAKVHGACKKTFGKAIDFEYEGLMDEAISKAQVLMSKDDFIEFAHKSRMAYYDSFNKDEQYLDTAEDYIKASGKKNPVVLSFVATDICNNLKSDPKAVKKAIKWAKQALKIDPTESNFNTYCQTLLTAKEYDEVLELVNKEIENKKTTYNVGTLQRLKQYTEQLKATQG